MAFTLKWPKLAWKIIYSENTIYAVQQKELFSFYLHFNIDNDIDIILIDIDNP